MNIYVYVYALRTIFARLQVELNPIRKGGKNLFTGRLAYSPVPVCTVKDVEKGFNLKMCQFSVVHMIEDNSCVIPVVFKKVMHLFAPRNPLENLV